MRLNQFDSIDHLSGLLKIAVLAILISIGSILLSVFATNNFPLQSIHPKPAVVTRATTATQALTSVAPSQFVEAPMGWKTFVDKTGEIRFNYPPNWHFKYDQEDPSTIGFYLLNKSADLSYADHRGNEILTVFKPEDTKSPNLPSNYTQDQNYFLINGYLAHRTPYGLDIAVFYISSKKYKDINRVLVIRVWDKTNPLIDKVFSTMQLGK
jgi:hypothetical protein